MYVLIIEDSHTDTSVELYRTKSRAVEQMKKLALLLGRLDDPNDLIDSCTVGELPRILWYDEQGSITLTSEKVRP
jgi:hypothetical protein